MTIETRNRQWGFYGTCVTNGHPDPDLAWDMMIRILTDPLGDFRFTSEVARDLLDAPWGRHLADAVAGQSVVRAMSKLESDRRWMKSTLDYARAIVQAQADAGN